MVMYDYDSVYVVEYGLQWPAEWGTASTQVCFSPIKVGNIINTDDGMALSYTVCNVSGGNRAAILPVAWHWMIPTTDGQIKIRDFRKAIGGTDYMDVVDCREPTYRGLSTPLRVYYAGVNVTPYVGPPEFATEPTTWGAIKAMFR
jgi:hypothetical protein